MQMRLIRPVLVLAVAVLGARSMGASVVMSPFTPTNPIGGAPIGWAFAGNKFVGSILDSGTGQNLLYSTNLTGGNVQAFGGAVTLAATYGLEHYVSSSIGAGGFPVGDVYVASGNNIEHITNAGVAQGLFISSSTPLNGDVRGITFDAVGSWSNLMLVTTHNGYVYKVNSSGFATQIGFTGEDTEGLDVAPTNVGAGAHWGTLNGDLFITSENSGKVRAIDPITLNMTTVATLQGAEELDFVPLNLGASGNPLEGFYAANYNLNVLKAPAVQFNSMLGDVIVTQESGPNTGNINDITAPFTSTVVGLIPNQPEDGLFVTADILAHDGIPEPTSLSLIVGAGLLMLRRRRAIRV